MRKKHFLAVALTVALALGACSASYKRVETGGAERAAVHLDKSRSVLVAVPADGAYGNKHYAGSGQSVAQQTAAAFSRHAPRVDTAPAGMLDRTTLLEDARKLGDGYLVVPVISHWERRTTEWSGRPSRAAVGLSVIDVPSGQQVTSSLLESRSRIMTLTSTSPDSLLRHMIGDYVDSLY
ncbi:MAG TPA: DUF4823 domain-containing protein [Stellaceae bacterium]|nr:DUF4823 domain-containing protein [Stellaceae bacterium]